ncbi:hypothetical protein, unlikely [Trypanosoma brucei gambiense DAL972]|uniref:Uncharacterized protein n=1 Tax=Trypanosoma brucei gambiense (strain MHOM/CI/86/DAL972) TaxID=679716 RepID=D0A117_TRYB9|nr:hypothetical protein, unlikely [Trypanosoma brucei gambiense DAL972]CBH14959.1 hypothetical protein, unlikely [Trypanosoma brucei gambiense DAL972]|eukprot:XP_011777225.1 hypothetical protein, unlikely [Trypanosoma brucei gambiense DAL972]
MPCRGRDCFLRVRLYMRWSHVSSSCVIPYMWSRLLTVTHAKTRDILLVLFFFHLCWLLAYRGPVVGNDKRFGCFLICDCTRISIYIYIYIYLHMCDLNYHIHFIFCLYTPVLLGYYNG